MTEKTKGRRRIHDLQTEVSDGTVLCEVIEAVTQQKVPDVNRKPKSNSAMVTNIQACLNFLLAKVSCLPSPAGGQVARFSFRMRHLCLCFSQKVPTCPFHMEPVFQVGSYRTVPYSFSQNWILLLFQIK